MINIFQERINIMAKTKSSVHGIQTKKIVTVHSYVKSNGTRVKQHRRSTPNWDDSRVSWICKSDIQEFLSATKQ